MLFLHSRFLKSLPYVLTGLFLIQFIQYVPLFDIGHHVDAGYIQDDNSGSAIIDFEGSLAGLISNIDINHDPMGSVTSPTGSGYLLTSPIRPASFSSWNVIQLSYVGHAPDIEVRSCDGTIIRNRTNYETPYDISGISSSEGCLQISLRLSNADTVLSEIKTERESDPVVLFDINGPDELVAGECGNYTIRWSLSYTSTDHVVVSLPLPRRDENNSRGYDTGTINAGYAQYPFSNLTIVDVSDGGIIYTGSTGMVLSGGYMIDTNSIYWETDYSTPGTMLSHDIVICTDAGTQDGVTYNMVTNLRSPTVDDMTDSIETLVSSNTEMNLQCQAAQNEYIEAITTDQVDIVIQLTHNGVDSTQDEFNTMVSVDYDNIVDALVSDCGFTLSDARSRISVPTGFTSLDASNVSEKDFGTIYATNTNVYSGQTPTFIHTTTSIDINGCAGNIDLNDALGVHVQGDTYDNAIGCGDIHYRRRENENISIGDYVWDDENHDGRQSVGEHGLSGVEIKLLLCSSNNALDGIELMSTVSDSNGFYMFDGLSSDSYRIAVPVLPVDLVMSGYTFTSTTVGTVDGSDIQLLTKESDCVTLTAQTDDEDLDVGLMIPDTNGGGSGVGGGGDKRYSTCSYTTTTNEYDYGRLGNMTLAYETNRENVHDTQIGYYDNDCNGSDAHYTQYWGNASSSSRYNAIEVNASGSTFFYVNLHGDNDIVPVQNTLKQNILSLNRVDDRMLVDHSSVWTNEHGVWQEEPVSSRGTTYCHSSTEQYGNNQPTVNTGAFDGTTIPLASAVGPGWSTNCDNTSRWVLNYARCLNSDAYPASIGSSCADAPSRYQFRLYVHPDVVPVVDQCESNGSNYVFGDSNSTYIYVGAMSVDSGDDTLVALSHTNDVGTFYFDVTSQQPYRVYNTPQVQNIKLTSDILGPSELDVNGTGHYLFDIKTNVAPGVPLSGGAVITLESIAGQCPIVSGLTGSVAGWMYNPTNCELSGPVNEGVASGDPVWDMTPYTRGRRDREYDEHGNTVRELNYDTSSGFPIPRTLFLREFDEDNQEFRNVKFQWDNVAHEWTPNRLTERENLLYNNTGGVEESRINTTSYTWDGNQWIPNNYTEDYEYDDEDGNYNFWYKSFYRDSGVWVPEEWETEDQSSTGYRYSYYEWDDVQWVIADSEYQEFTYDGSGDLVLEENREWDGSAYVLSRKFNYMYDENHHRIDSTGYRRDGISWIPDWKNIEDFDDNGNNILKSFYRRDGTEWEYDGGSEAEYNQNGYETMRAYYGQGHLPNTKYVYVRDIHGNILERVEYVHDGVGGWKPLQKYVSVYDNYNHQIENIGFRLNAGVWIPFSRNSNEYDSNQNMILYMYERWNGNNMSWNIFSKNEYLYDDNHNMLENIGYSRVHNEIQPTRRSLRTYDESGHVLTARYYNVHNVIYPSKSSVAFDVYYSSILSGTVLTHTVDGAVGLGICNSSETINDSVQTRYVGIQNLSNPDLLDPPDPDAPYDPDIDETSNPIVVGDKFLDNSVIEPNGNIIYTIQSSNVGDALSLNTYVIDAIPDGTTLNTVVTSGTIIRAMTDFDEETLPLGSMSYNCDRCQIYFSDEVLSPAYPNITNPYVWSVVESQFELGVDNGSGTWSPPAGMTDPRYVAIAVISDAAPNESLLDEDNRRVGIVVDNDSNDVGAVLRNTIMVIGDDILPSVANTVHTTIIDEVVNTLAGVVYHDVNTDSQFDINDEGLGGVIVVIYDDNNIEVARTVTESDGSYLFSGLIDNSYTVSYESTGLIASSLYYNQPLTPAIANTGMISDSPVGIVVSSNSISNVMLFNASVGTLYNFGLHHHPISIVGHVYEDVNRVSGYQGADNMDGGLVVILYDDNYVELERTLTSARGEYKFDNLDQGVYNISYELPSNAVAYESWGGSLSGSTNPFAIGSLQGGSDPHMIHVGNLVWGDEVVNNDFGYYYTYCGDGIVQTPNGLGEDGIDNNGVEECDGTMLQGCIGSYFVCSSQCTCTSVVDCPMNSAGENSFGNTCDDGDPSTANDRIQMDCSCRGEAVACYIQGGVGASCDDGDPSTANDRIQTDCSCRGNVIACYIQGGVGASCDDGDPLTKHDSIQLDCLCKGLISIGAGGKCGDGVINQAREECDEGVDNGKPGVFCTAVCKLPPHDSTIVCGDGKVSPLGADGVIDTDDDEQCDNGDLNGTMNANDDGIVCDDNCHMAVGYAVCGDGILQEAGPDAMIGTNDDEQCDDGNTQNGDGCNASCQREDWIGDCGLQGNIYVDENSDHLFNNGEDGVSGQEILLLLGGETIKTVITNNHGSYTFDAIACDTDYEISLRIVNENYSPTSAQFNYDIQQEDSTTITVSAIYLTDFISLDNNNFGLSQKEEYLHMAPFTLPLVHPGTGTPDEDLDTILLKDGWRVFRNNPNIVTRTAPWTTIYPTDFVTSVKLRYNELPLKYQGSEWYIEDKEAGIFSPITFVDIDDGWTEKSHLVAARSGAVHIAGTAMPDEGSPIGIMAHSASYVSEGAGDFGAIFKTLVLTNLGSELKIYHKRSDGSYQEYLYTVVDIRKNIGKDDMSVYTDYLGEEVLVMGSCFNEGLIGSLGARMFVIAKRVTNEIDIPQKYKTMIDVFIQTIDDSRKNIIKAKVDTLLEKVDTFTLSDENKILLRGILNYLVSVLQ